MRITLLLVGKTTDKHLQALIDDYTARLAHYVQFDVQVIPELRASGKLSEAEQKVREGELILKQAAEGTLILLDEGGEEMRSVELAAWLQRRMNSGGRQLIFAVGGPFGFSEAVYRRADGKLSLSRLTFSHQMIRLLFTEQLYRAFTILRGEKYHHE